MEKLVKHTKAYKSYGNTGSNPGDVSMLEDHQSPEDPNFRPMTAADSHKETDKSRPASKRTILRYAIYSYILSI